MYIGIIHHYDRNVLIIHASFGYDTSLLALFVASYTIHFSVLCNLLLITVLLHLFIGTRDTNHTVCNKLFAKWFRKSCPRKVCCRLWSCRYTSVVPGLLSRLKDGGWHGLASRPVKVNGCLLRLRRHAGITPKLFARQLVRTVEIRGR
jgi:hypothetical protein